MRGIENPKREKKKFIGLIEYKRIKIFKTKKLKEK